MAHDSEDTSIEVGLSSEGTTSIKATGLTRALRWVLPKRYYKNLTVETLMAKLATTGTFTEDERSLVDWAINGQALKLQRREQVAEYILECDRTLPEMVEQPRALPPKGDDTTPGVIAEQANDYFWERFWADAEVASADYVQRILGQVGARKARSPGSVSLRTLDVIRCLEPHHAVLLQRLSAYIFDDGLVPAQSELKHEYVRVGLTTPYVVDLQDAGLIALEEIRYDAAEFDLPNGMSVRTLTPPEPGQTRPKGWTMVMMLTRAGRELAALQLAMPDEKQLHELIKSLTRSTAYEWKYRHEETWKPIEDRERPIPAP